jgi:hypothetical protein
MQARCYRLVCCLVRGAKDTNPLSERLKTNLLLDSAPAQLVEALSNAKDTPVLASSILSALAAYVPLALCFKIVCDLRAAFG